MSIGSILASPVARIAAATTLGVGGLLIARELAERSSEKKLSGAVKEAMLGTEIKHHSPQGESGLTDALRGLGVSSENTMLVTNNSKKHGLNDATIEDYFQTQINGFGNSEQVATTGFVDLISEKPGLKTFKEQGNVLFDWVNAADSGKTSDLERQAFALSELGLARADAAKTAKTSMKLSLNTDTVRDFFDVQINGFGNSSGETIKGFTKLISTKEGLQTFREQGHVKHDWQDVTP